MATPEDRITTLEIRAAEQERMIEDLSGLVAEQWKVIDRLEKAMAQLRERLETVEDGGRADVPVTRPPHW